jgi:hypothetical protein
MFMRPTNCAAESDAMPEGVAVLMVRAWGWAVNDGRVKGCFSFVDFFEAFFFQLVHFAIVGG